MTETHTFIDYLKFEQPKIWESISSAAADGLIVIDEGNDAVTATNRLLLTYPDLHTVLNLLVENWIRKKAEEMSLMAAKNFLQEGSKENG